MGKNSGWATLGSLVCKPPPVDPEVEERKARERDLVDFVLGRASTPDAAVELLNAEGFWVEWGSPEERKVTREDMVRLVRRVGHQDLTLRALAWAWAGPPPNSLGGEDRLLVQHQEMMRLFPEYAAQFEGPWESLQPGWTVDHRGD